MPFACNQELIVKQLPDDKWRLETNIYYYDSRYTDSIIKVPLDYVSDGSSIPRFAWWIVGHPLQGQHALAGFLHDFITENKMFDRKTCDLIYLEAHKDLGTPFIKRNLCYRAVRLNSIVKGYDSLPPPANFHDKSFQEIKNQSDPIKSVKKDIKF